MLLANETFPVVENAPPAVIVPVACLLNRPLLSTVMAPSAVKLFCRLNVVPRSVAEPTATAAANVVAPVAAFVWTRSPLMAMAPLKFVVPALVTVTSARP